MHLCISAQRTSNVSMWDETLVSKDISHVPATSDVRSVVHSCSVEWEEESCERREKQEGWIGLLVTRQSDALREEVLFQASKISSLSFNNLSHKVVRSIEVCLRDSIRSLSLICLTHNVGATRSSSELRLQSPIGTSMISVTRYLQRRFGTVYIRFATAMSRICGHGQQQLGTPELHPCDSELPRLRRVVVSHLAPDGAFPLSETMSACSCSTSIKL